MSRAQESKEGGLDYKAIIIAEGDPKGLRKGYSSRHGGGRLPAPCDQ